MADKLATNPPSAKLFILSYPTPFVLLVTINNERAMNSIGTAGHWEAEAIFDWFDHEPSLRAAIITGVGNKAFCAGADLLEQQKIYFGSGSSPAAVHPSMTRYPPGGFAGISRATHRKKPIIAAVNGYALGGGFEITLNCDMVVASPTASFALPEALRGLSANAGGLPRLMRIAGLQIASEVALTGRRLSAEEAHRLNLVNKVSRRSDTVVEEAVEMAKLVAGLSPDAIIVTKFGIREDWNEGNIEQAVRNTEQRFHRALMKGENAKIGLTAFAQKKQPLWVPSNFAKRKYVWSRTDLTGAEEGEQGSSAPNGPAVSTSPVQSMTLVSGQPNSDLSPSHQEIVPQTLSSTQIQRVSEDGADFSIAFEEQDSPEPGGNRALLYIGDQQAINAMVLDLSDGPPQSSRYLVPVTTKRSLQSEDLDYLRTKGCFSLPSERVCEELITRYFRLVHPFLPIINAAHFLQEFVNGTYRKSSLLVLWSMFSAASSFVDSSTIQEAGYRSRKDMKLAMHRRAKYLFDSDLEEDKIKVVQAAVLLAFFYTDTEDRTGAWHWTGTAISLCQTLGLHRDLKAITPDYHFTCDKLRLFRRIWWSLFVRDRWLSLGHGRPMRIQLQYCDTPMPTSEDLTADLEELPSAVTEKYLAANQMALATLWVKVVHLSKVLGHTIENLYSLQKPLPEIQVVKKCEDEIKQLYWSSNPQDADSVMCLHTYVVQLFQAAATIVLYRPYLKKGPNQSSQSGDACLRTIARDKAKAAATQANTALESLIELDAVKWLQPVSLAALMPVMQVHLLEKKLATGPLSRSFSSHRLRLCMMVLSELRDNYWGAEVAYRIFAQADALPHGRSKHQNQLRSSTSSNPSDENHVNELTNMPPLTFDSGSFDTSQLRSLQTQPTTSNDYIFNPSNIFMDQFSLESALDLDAYGGFDLGATLDGFDFGAADFAMSKSSK